MDKRISELKVTQWKKKKEPCAVIVQEWSICNNYKWKVIFKLYKRYLYIINVNNYMLMVLSVPTSQFSTFSTKSKVELCKYNLYCMQFESFCHINPSAVLLPFCVSVLHNRDKIFFLKTSKSGPKRGNPLTFI